MKVNFWQALGLVLVIVGVVLFARKKTGEDDTVKPNPADARPAMTSPSTGPAATAPVVP